MREILFRGKLKNIGNWQYGDLVHSPSGKVFIVKEHNNDEGTKFLLDKETIGQFTGFLDKNGKKIFEGDIVEFDDFKRSAVIWGNGEYNQITGFRLASYPLFSVSIVNSKLFEVIGNVYDNSELLNEV